MSTPARTWQRFVSGHETLRDAEAAVTVEWDAGRTNCGVMDTRNAGEYPPMRTVYRWVVTRPTPQR